MNPKHEEKLRAAACRFRSALESHDLELLPELCEPFPSGWCGDAAPLLSQYLTDSGLGDFDYVCGETQEVDPAESPQSHAWLEQDGFIIDITADQFPEIGEAVMITRDRTWHSQFIECSRYLAGIDVYDAGAADRLREAYEGLKRFLNAQPSCQGWPERVSPSAPD